MMTIMMIVFFLELCLMAALVFGNAAEMKKLLENQIFLFIDICGQQSGLTAHWKSQKKQTIETKLLLILKHLH